MAVDAEGGGRRKGRRGRRRGRRHFATKFNVCDLNIGRFIADATEVHDLGRVCQSDDDSYLSAIGRAYTDER